MKLKDKLKKMKCMESIVFYRRYKRLPGIKKIIESYVEGNTILFQEKCSQKLNSRKNIYLIRFDYDTAGFFAYWWFGLYELYFADKFNMIPVIEWTNKCPYYEEDGVNGIENPFEYYFEQYSHKTIKETLQDNNIYTATNINTFKLVPYKERGDMLKLAKINKKYMKLKENVETKIIDDIKNTIGNKKTLAVHVRGVEWGNVQGHPIPLNLDNYTNEIEKALKEKNFEQIFLATDSDETIDYFSRKYKEKVVFYKDVVRAPKGSTKLVIFDNSIQRENHHYLMGYEVLRDMMTLAYCQGLIAGLSNISAAAELTKLSNDEEYLYKHIFEQKINKSGISADKAVKNMKK